MRLTVNGEAREIEGPLSVARFLERHGLGERRVAVDHNGTVLHRREFETVLLQDGDTLEIVHMVGGG